MAIGLGSCVPENSLDSSIGFFFVYLTWHRQLPGYGNVPQRGGNRPTYIKVDWVVHKWCHHYLQIKIFLAKGLRGITVPGFLLSCVFSKLCRSQLFMEEMKIKLLTLQCGHLRWSWRGRPSSAEVGDERRKVKHRRRRTFTGILTTRSVQVQRIVTSRSKNDFIFFIQKALWGISKCNKV